MNQIVTLEYLTEQGFSPTFPDRFWKRVNKKGPLTNPMLGYCWEWTGWKQKHKWPYGSIAAFKSTGSITAHRASWIIHFGIVPDGMFVLHKCDFCPCVNPYHLFLGTAKDNTNDMIKKGRFVAGNHSGEHNGRATVTWEMVRQIRARYVPWRVTREQIAKEFGISYHVVKCIVNRKTWITPKSEYQDSKSKLEMDYLNREPFHD